MFIEPNIRKGWLEVICGSMFSGKTEELIRRLRRATFANQRILIFKPQIDTRYSSQAIVSHNATSIPSVPVASSQDILLHAKEVDIIGIDEAQFFDDGLPMVCETLALRGIRVIIAGLDMDYKGKPFGPMPALLSCAEFITKLHAICMCCGNLATHSFRKTQTEEKIALGETDVYEARCRTCYHSPEVEKSRSPEVLKS